MAIAVAISKSPDSCMNSGVNRIRRSGRAVLFGEKTRFDRLPMPTANHMS
jgi:hypothetical protein